MFSDKQFCTARKRKEVHMDTKLRKKITVTKRPTKDVKEETEIFLLKLTNAGLEQKLEKEEYNNFLLEQIIFNQEKEIASQQATQNSDDLSELISLLDDQEKQVNAYKTDNILLKTQVDDKKKQVKAYKTDNILLKTQVELLKTQVALLKKIKDQ
jgi:hypothetical protein